MCSINDEVTIVTNPNTVIVAMADYDTYMINDKSVLLTPEEFEAFKLSEEFNVTYIPMMVTHCSINDLKEWLENREELLTELFLASEIDAPESDINFIASACSEYGYSISDSFNENAPYFKVTCVSNACASSNQIDFWFTTESAAKTCAMYSCNPCLGGFADVVLSSSDVLVGGVEVDTTDYL